jgi:hypothetical protein
MATWKVLSVVALAGAVFALASATVIVPMTESAAPSRWQWVAGLAGATVCMAGVLSLFLRVAGASMRR